MSKNTPTIIRAPRGSESPYFATARSAAQHRGLSFEARGLLWYLLSKPDDWAVRLSDIKKEGGIGIHKAKKLIRELKEHGYLVMERTKDKDGKFTGACYRVYEEAQSISTEIHPMENPSGGKSTPLQNIEGLQNTDKNNLSDKSEGEKPNSIAQKDIDTIIDFVRNSAGGLSVDDVVDMHPNNYSKTVVQNVLRDATKKKLVALDKEAGVYSKPSNPLDEFFPRDENGQPPPDIADAPFNDHEALKWTIEAEWNVLGGEAQALATLFVYGKNGRYAHLIEDLRQAFDGERISTRDIKQFRLWWSTKYPDLELPRDGMKVQSRLIEWAKLGKPQGKAQKSMLDRALDELNMGVPTNG